MNELTTLTELEVLIYIHDMLKTIATFVIAHFGVYLYRAFCGGWFRLDKYGGSSV